MQLGALTASQQREQTGWPLGVSISLFGSHEQIFGVLEQVRGQDQTYISDISLQVIWEKQRTSTFSHHRRVKRLNSIPLCYLGPILTRPPA
jgi:hypothetical protein